MSDITIEEAWPGCLDAPAKALSDKIDEDVFEEIDSTETLVREAMTKEERINQYKEV